MSGTKLLGLPPISPELKSISPYLQRADELKSQEPVISYWCAYYAAQLGISLKARDSPSRDLLFALLATLERMKKELGPTDAIDIEVASSAYVENFALRVFAMADNEDRKGQGTRSTAKKFLAAANFLEVLKVFPKSEISESNEDKIRYAKWKAADIAKAYREGRKPTPGPAGSGFEQPQPPNPSESPPIPPIFATNASSSSGSSTIPATPPKPTTHSPPNQPSTPPRIKRTSPPPHMDQADITRAIQDFVPHTPPRRAAAVNLGIDVESGLGVGRWAGETTPGSWSTAATPGTARGTPGMLDHGVGGNLGGYGVALGPGAVVYGQEQESPTGVGRGKGKEKRRTGSGSSSGSGSGGGGVLKKPWVGGELENSMGMGGPFVDGSHQRQYSNESANTANNNNGNGKKVVHFTPSVVGGQSSTAGSPPASPGYESGFGVSPHEAGNQVFGSEPIIPSSHVANGTPTPWLTSPPPPNANLGPPLPQGSPHRYTADLPLQPGFANVAPPAPQAGWGAGGVVAPQQPSMIVPPTSPPSAVPHPHTYQATPPVSPPSLPTRLPSPPRPQRASAPAPPPPPPPPEMELAPSVIAKAQKHCRFAISALDYEDGEQAKKELRAALAALGG